jgi:amidophosphoribosyltransferase
MCGLIGIARTPEAAYEAFLGLMNLQHRGQDGAGILTVDSIKGQFSLQKGSGLVENIFSERTFRNLKGLSAIGHTRYATIGRRDPNLLQPFINDHFGIGIGHNGNIVNCYELKEELLKNDKNCHFATESDSEVILNLITYYLKTKPKDFSHLFSAIEKTMKDLIGSYSVVGLLKDGSLFGFRDPNGIRPMVLGKRKNNAGEIAFAISSESAALNYLGYNDLEEIQPAEAIYISAKGEMHRKILTKQSNYPCMFEWVYFARVESQMGNTEVYKARFQLGAILAEYLKNKNITADVVLPVPETSRIAAIAIAESMNIPFRELLIKNRYVNRTFILDDQQSRKEAIKRKLYPVASEIAGKRCLVVDDSIVRGNTAIQIVKLIKQAGAKEVILVSTCPPIISPCYYGIDFPSTNELIAHGHNEEEIARIMGADKVIYQTVEGLKKALEQNSLCTGCLTQEYPTDIVHAITFENKRTEDRKNNGDCMPQVNSIKNKN